MKFCRAPLIIFAVMLCASSSFAQVNPGVRVSLDYEFLEGAKVKIIEPLIQKSLINHSLPLNVTMTNGDLIDIFYAQATFDNLTVTAFKLDWDNTHILHTTQNTTSNVSIHNMSLTLTVGYNIHCKLGRFTGVIGLGLNGLNLDIELTIALNDAQTNYYPQLVSAEFSYDFMSLSCDHMLPNFVFKSLSYVINDLVKGFILKDVSQLLISNANGLLKAQLENGLQITYQDINISLLVPQSPQVILSNGKQIGIFDIVGYFVNTKTGKSAPGNFKDPLPLRNEDGQQLQVFLSSNFNDQLIWLASQLNIEPITLDKTKLPASFPVTLDTTGLKILMPQLASTYGEAKGVYVQVFKGSQNPRIVVRDGRLIAIIPLGLTLIVDKDSTLYPQSNLTECTTCELALQLDTSLMLDITIFNQDDLHFGAHILNLEFISVNVLAGMPVEPSSVITTLNPLLSTIVKTVNSQLKAGIPDPFEGKWGLHNSTLTINNNHFAFEVSMENFDYFLDHVSIF